MTEENIWKCPKFLSVCVWGTALMGCTPSMICHAVTFYPCPFLDKEALVQHIIFFWLQFINSRLQLHLRFENFLDMP